MKKQELKQLIKEMVTHAWFQGLHPIEEDLIPGGKGDHIKEKDVDIELKFI